MSQPTILRVARRGDRWHYILIPPGDLMLRHAAHPAVDTEIDTDLLHLLCNQMADAVHSANASVTRDASRDRRLTQIGRAIFATLFPGDAEAVRLHLAHLTTPLMVLSDDREIPWECLFVADVAEGTDGFLGLRAEVGRSIVSVHVPQLPVVRRHQRWRCLLIANPTGDLDATGEEASHLERWFAQRGFLCSVLSRQRATKEEVVSQLLEEWDIIHYSGHVDPDTGSLVLNNGMLPPRALQPLLRGAPVVFINGCESASVELLTEALIGGGAQAVIGSLYQLPPLGATAFSGKFYECLLSGSTLGAAVRQARQYVFERSDCAACWASFVLFGDPCMKVQVDRDPLEEALRRVGLGPDSFDSETAAVIREAYRCGYQTGSITSACILAGLLAVSDPLLLERLRYFRIRSDALDRAFRSVFTKSPEGRKQIQDGEQPLEFSENAATWLRAARDFGDVRITRSAIYRAWVRSGGGGAGQILRRLGVPLESLEPDRPFPPALKKVGSLTEHDCTAPAWRLLHMATGLAASTGASAVATVHVAAAMQSDSGSPLALGLDQAGVHIDIGDWLRRGEARQMLGGEVECSETVGALLKIAFHSAQEEQRQICEEDLFRAFLRSGGGSVGRALQQVGVWRKLADTLPRSLDAIQSVGSINREGSTATAWSALLSTAELAGSAGRSVVCSFDLLAGLQVDPNGILAQRLARLGIRIQLRSWVQLIGPSRALVGAVECSENANRAFLLAQASAAADLRSVDEADLLQAFVSSGGGRSGKQFEESCCPLVVLTSELFIRGSLDLDRLDSDAQQILQRAVEFASEKGWPAVSRDHLVYALTSHGAYFKSRLRADDLNPEQMGDLAFSYLSIPPPTSGTHTLTTDLRSFASDLVRVLCRAETRVSSGQQIGERDLAWAWADSGGGRFGQVLVEHNFRLRRLLEES